MGEKFENNFFPFVINTIGADKMFKVGDNIFYPLHGAGTIESIEEKKVLGEKRKYYVIKMPVGDVKVMVPTENAENVGVRNLISHNVVDEVFKSFDMYQNEDDVSWSKRYRENMERMKSGNILDIAQVVNTLTFKQKEKGLSTGEKKMLTNARQILVSELVLTDNKDKKEIEQIIDSKMQATYDKKMEELL